MAFKMKGHSLPGPNQRKSPAKIAPIIAAVAPMIMDKMKKKKEDKSELVDEMSKKESPGKFWATAAKIAIGASKKHSAQKQARDDAKQAGIQAAYGNKKL